MQRRGERKDGEMGRCSHVWSVSGLQCDSAHADEEMKDRDGISLLRGSDWIKERLESRTVGDSRRAMRGGRQRSQHGLEEPILEEGCLDHLNCVCPQHACSTRAYRSTRM